MHWDKISIIGAGLLGGSLGLALRERKLAAKVHAFVRRQASVEECLQRGAADAATTNLARAVESAGLIVLCTPLAQMRELTEQMRPFLMRGAIVTDVGSVKGSVVRELSPLVSQAGAEFIGSHPMAGSEQMGLSAARADLFHNAVCLVTPSPASSAAGVRAVEAFWQDIGGCPMRMSPETHDDLVSRSSHLPHVVAAELANYVLSTVHPRQQAQHCANGFRDTTRIASGSPEMWRDISLANRRNLSKVLAVFIEDLQEFQLALERSDLRAVEEFFSKAKERRDQWRAQSAGTSPE